MDDNQHGSHVSGTIGAEGSNGVGVVGVNWDVQLMACKFLGAGGSGSTDGAVACLNYVALMKDRGVNSSSHPASYYLPSVIAVAATTETDDLASFSNYGKQTAHLGAPGTNILSTTPGKTYATLSGTSMAAPHVTGVAALLKAQDPSRDWRAIRNLILAGGDDRASLTSSGVSGAVRIDLSRNRGASWETLFASVTNDGAQEWKVTGPASSGAQIRVCDQTLTVCDTSKGTFTIK